MSDQEFTRGVPVLRSEEDAERMRRGKVVAFWLIVRDFRDGPRPGARVTGLPRRGTFRIWAAPGAVLTPDFLREEFEKCRQTAWRHDRFGRDAWWYVEPEPIMADARWVGPLLQMPLP